MNARFLPAVVFVSCVMIGFGVGLEADGQSTDESAWATPGWELPWGMSWPASVSLEATSSAEDVQISDAASIAADSEGQNDEVGPTESTENPTPGSEREPGIFPGLVYPPPAGSTPESEPGTEGTAPPAAASATAATLNAQLAQLETLDDQIRSMREASQTARTAMEAALAGVPPEPEEPVEPATPAQIENSLVLLTDMVKKMKPSKAAALLQEWNDRLAIGILRRLGSRKATPILSKMPVDVSGRLTSQIAAGVGALPQATAASTDAPPQGEK